LALIDSFGDVSGSEKLSKALDKILDQIAQYETMMGKLRSGGKLSIDELAAQGQLESDIRGGLGKIKSATTPEELSNLDERKAVIDEAKRIYS
jgi:hypothetical protein